MLDCRVRRVQALMRQGKLESVTGIDGDPRVTLRSIRKLGEGRP